MFSHKKKTKATLLAKWVSCAVMLACTGCIHCITPSKCVRIEPRDSEVYPGELSGEAETRHRVAIIVLPSDHRDSKDVVRLLDSALTRMVSNLEFFEVVATGNLDSIMRGGRLQQSWIDANIPPDTKYLITARLNTFFIERIIHSSKSGTSYSYKGQIGVDFRFYETANQRLVLSKDFPPKNFSSYKDEMNFAVTSAGEKAQEMAQQFVTSVCARYAPPAIVLETRGGGKIAQISMGENYGIFQDTKVDFIEYVDGRRGVAPSVIATGKTLKKERKIDTAWIYVNDYQKAGVKEGHYVRINAE